ncbi:hypothetical protein [Moraxella lacunata]
MLADILTMFTLSILKNNDKFYGKDTLFYNFKIILNKDLKSGSGGWI